MAHIHADLFYLVGGIGWTNWHANFAHHLDIGNVVAHEDNLIGCQLVLLQILLKFQRP